MKAVEPDEPIDDIAKMIIEGAKALGQAQAPGSVWEDYDLELQCELLNETRAVLVSICSSWHLTLRLPAVSGAN